MTIAPTTISPPEGMIDNLGEPISPSRQAEAFYKEILHALVEADLPFLVAGGYAVAAYTGIKRATKDLDIFTTPGNFPRVLGELQQRGYDVVIQDERWIGKVRNGAHFVDLIFSSATGMVPVQEEWFAHARRTETLGAPVCILSPTELIWSKVFIQNRHRFDGADVVHVILKQHDAIDWRRLLAHMDAHWEILLSHLLNFRWIYPSERNCIPRWLMDELLARLKQQLELPAPQTQICRGRMLSQSDYRHAVEEWSFADLGGEGLCRND
jgi:hypothetical protein